MSTGGNLPDEIIPEILLRLPTKSLGRCKCVSKSWHSLISDPKFPKTHLTLNHRRRPKLLISDGQLFDILSIDGEPEPHVLSSNIDFKQPRKWICIYGSCDGLILVLDQTYQLFLLNPITQECKKLPDLENLDFEDNITCGFGYDSSSDDYKVVIFDSAVVYVYSLRIDAWNIVQSLPLDNDAAGLSHGPGIFLNGSIHWFCFLGSLVSIVAFDLTDEKFKNVPQPREFHPLANYEPCLWLYEIGGCLCLLNDCPSIDVWVMKEYGVESSWTKFGGIATRDVVPVFYLPEEEIVLIQDNINIPGINVVTYDVKEKASRYITLSGLAHTYESMSMCTFRDSLVSPEQFNRGQHHGSIKVIT